MVSFNFPKGLRLLNGHQFRRVSKQGGSCTGHFLSLTLCQADTLKLGLTVSRKFGNAVERNRFKRLVREAFRLSQHDLPPLHLNVRPTSPAAQSATLHEIQSELKALCASWTTSAVS